MHRLASRSKTFIIFLANHWIGIFVLEPTSLEIHEQILNNLRPPSDSRSPLDSTDLRFINPQPDISIHCKTTNTAQVHHAVCVFTVTHSAYLQRDGQAELPWVAGYLPNRRRLLVLVVTGSDIAQLCG